MQVQGDPVTGLVLETEALDASGRVVGTGETEQLSLQLVNR